MKGPQTATAKFSLGVTEGDVPTPYIEHWVLQLHGVAPEHINHPDTMDTILSRIVSELELTQVSSHSHYFGPGVSAVIILSESHLSAHSWPEIGYLHVDIVTCVKKLTEQRLREVLGQAFSPVRLQLTQLEY